MRGRSSLFDNGFVNAGIFLFSILGSGAVMALAREEFSATASIIAGAAALVPAFLLAFFVVYYIDRSRGPRQITSTHGITLTGIFYAEAVVLALIPMAREEGQDIEWGVAFPAWVLALACAFAGRAAKKRKRAREDMARLAQSNVNLATRFMVRPDEKGWPEIQPFTVLAYQRRFEKALAAIGPTVPASSWGLTDEQAAGMIKAADEYEYFPRREDHGVFDAGDDHYYPGPVVALVLAFLDATPEQRDRERAEWAAAVATRVNASEIRDALRPHVATLFKKHAKQYAA
jgi:hypothetical protein